MTEIFDSPLSARFEVDEPRRIIKGLAVPYGPAGSSRGRKFAFAQGTLTYSEVSRVKVLLNHDYSKAVGVVTDLNDTPDGLFATMRIAKGAAGDEALSMAAEGVWDGLSIGLGEGGKFATRDGVNHAVSVPLMEISITPMPSFSDARVHSVAASAAPNRKEPAMGNEQTTTEVATTIDADAAPDFSAVTDAIREGFQTLTIPPRETPEAPGAQFAVTEELPYRFDGIGGGHGFTEDIRSSLFGGDPVARQRLETFMGEVFNVTGANTAALDPTQNRPELYVPQLQFNRPLWEMVSTGGLDDKTPFTIPKFSSATNLSAAHTEGVEPTEATFAATSQTITPGAVSGKANINREVFGQGGNPQTDQILWGEMVGSYYEGIETKVKNALAAVGTAETQLSSAVDEALVDAVQNIFTGLQYVRGGNRYTGLALDGSLFGALVNASDTTGRKLLPVNAPQNSQGSASAAFDRVSIGNVTGRAAWALGTGNAALSYLFVPASVYAWASAPKKFTFEFQVSTVTLAIWGYSAAAVTRDSDVKPIDYTVADA